MTDIKLCDIVHLNSGGPSMAVIGINSKLAICIWGDDLSSQKCHPFGLAALTKEI
jgi:uncharacterized protein YodC (DUF2158 family)